MPSLSLKSILPVEPRCVCVPSEATIGEALRLMMQHQLGQLPVIDDRGQLVGMISADAILSTLYYSKGSAPILSLPVNHCQDKANSVDFDSDLFTAIAQLNTWRGLGAATLTITKNCQPIALFSERDLTTLCHKKIEAHTLLHTIEGALRKYLRAALQSNLVSQPAPLTPSLAMVDQLSLCQLANLISDNTTWDALEDALAPRNLFMQWMAQAPNAL